MKYNIRKNISRKISTGSYENITISVDIEKEIECQEEDVGAFLDELTSMVVEDFRKTNLEVMEELGISEKKAWGDKAVVPVSTLSKEDMKDIFGE